MRENKGVMANKGIMGENKRGEGVVRENKGVKGEHKIGMGGGKGVKGENKVGIRWVRVMGKNMVMSGEGA